MTIRHTVRVGQWWESNDTRRGKRIVAVVRILNYVTGRPVDESRIAGDAGRRASNAHCMDRVQVEDVLTRRRVAIRRDQFSTGPRGWTLYREAVKEERHAA